MSRLIRQIIPAIMFILVFGLISPGFAVEKKTEEKSKGKQDEKDKSVVWEIVPGRNISGIEFGKTRIEAVVKYFGNLDNRSKDKTTIFYQNTWGLNFTYDEKTNLVTSVMVVKAGAKDKKYITNSKIVVGEPIEKALYAYGKPTITTSLKGYKIHSFFIKDDFLTFVSKGPVIMMIWTGKKSAYEGKIDQVKEML